MHTSYQKGTPIQIILRNGELLAGKFKDHKSGKVLLEDGRIVELSDVRAMSIKKPRPKVQTNSSSLKFRINRQK